MSRKSVVLTIAAAVLGTSAFAFGPAPFWPFGGHDLENTRNPSAAVMIGPENVGSLGVSWVFETGGGADCAVVLCDVSATASLDGTSVYVPDWAGNLFSLDRRTGAVNWSRTMADYTGVTGNFTRATPAIHGNMLIFGDQGGRFFQGATLIAADKHTGDPIWATKVDEHP
ncbi:MAG TPA: PQQ-binding-like beta-propeller repeat protein, partial [Longimicrobiales bacterium]|nr:PQQ-binding-like beta-propeller repeat protein [Longimicrobiales bacterium]